MLEKWSMPDGRPSSRLVGLSPRAHAAAGFCVDTNGAGGGQCYPFFLGQKGDPKLTVTLRREPDDDSRTRGGENERLYSYGAACAACRDSITV